MRCDLVLPDAPFTRATAVAAGVSPGRLRVLLHDRSVRRVLLGVYVRNDRPDSLELRAAAAALVLPPFAVLCDRTAAWLLGVDTFDVRELEILPPLETFSLRHHTRTRRAGCAGGVRDLAVDDVQTIGGVLVTTPLRTALDLACRLRRGDALAALDAFMRDHDLSHDQLRRELTRWYRRRGVVQARQLVPLGSPLAESPGESWTRMAMIDRGLPPPRLQHWVLDGDHETFRLDLAYPRHRVAVEYDGREFHEDALRREHDRRRRRWLADRGWTVVVVTKDDFTADRVDVWTRQVRDSLRTDHE
ncbi:MAG: DUF559 domain-containing protein [Nocardioidaceae bacterium]